MQWSSGNISTGCSGRGKDPLPAFLSHRSLNDAGTTIPSADTCPPTVLASLPSHTELIPDDRILSHTTTRIPEMPFITLGGWSSSSLEAHVPSRSFMQQRLVAKARDEGAGGLVPVSVARLTHCVTNGNPLPWALSFPNYIMESVQILQRQ